MPVSYHARFHRSARRPHGAREAGAREAGPGEAAAREASPGEAGAGGTGARKTALALLGLCLAALVACGPPRDPQTPPEEPTPPEPSVPQVHPVKERAARLPVLLESLETREHFGETLIGALRMTETSWPAYAEGAVLPPGTEIALELREPGSGRRVTLWMEKGPDRWRFAADGIDRREGVGPTEGIGAADEAGARPGDPRATPAEEMCQRCHAEAPVDFVFRIPRPTGNGDPG